MSSRTLCTESVKTKNLKKSPNTSATILRTLSPSDQFVLWDVDIIFTFSFAGIFLNSSPQWSWCAGPHWSMIMERSCETAHLTALPLMSFPIQRRERSGGRIWRTEWWSMWVDISCCFSTGSSVCPCELWYLSPVWLRIMCVCVINTDRVPQQLSLVWCYIWVKIRFYMPCVFLSSWKSPMPFSICVKLSQLRREFCLLWLIWADTHWRHSGEGPSWLLLSSTKQLMEKQTAVAWSAFMWKKEQELYTSHTLMQDWYGAKYYINFKFSVEIL